MKLGGRAFDVLMALIEARGTILTKDQLIDRVWPGRVVEENTLQAQIAMLRKALAEDRDLVRTVSGYGYQFTGQVREAASAPPPVAARSATNLPQPVSELIGRDAELEEDRRAGAVASIAHADRRRRDRQDAPESRRGTAHASAVSRRCVDRGAGVVVRCRSGSGHRRHRTWPHTRLPVRCRPNASPRHSAPGKCC